MALPDQDSAVGHSFGLESDGVSMRLTDVVGLVLSVFGLGRDVGREDADPAAAGRPQRGTVTLVRALTADRAFDEWVHEAGLSREGVARRTTIVVFAHDGTPLARYHLENAWPSALEIGSLKAVDTTVITERLTLTYDRVEID